MIFGLLSPQPLLLTVCRKSENLQDENIYSIDRPRKLLISPLEQYKRLIPGNETLENTRLYVLPVLFTAAVDDPYTLIALAPDGDNRLDTSNFTAWQVCTVDAFWKTAKISLDPNTLVQVKPEKPDSVPQITNRNLKSTRSDPLLIMTASKSNFSAADLEVEGLGLVFAWVLSPIPTIQAISDLGGASDDLSTIMRGYNLSQLEGQSNITPFRIGIVIYGFDYGTRDIPTNLSVAAIAAYCLIVVFYIAYIVTTGHASTAWNSPTKYMMSALQSKGPKDIGHVSVGVDSMDTLRRSVGIRVSTVEIQGTSETREKLELVFEHDEETEKRGLTKVVRNRAY